MFISIYRLKVEVSNINEGFICKDISDLYSNIKHNGMIMKVYKYQYCPNRMPSIGPTCGRISMG